MISIDDALRRVIARQDLTAREMESLIGDLMDGRLEAVHQAALLAALATKGEAVEEIAGAAAAMRSRVIPIPHRRNDLVDTCGTGGDGRGTFNISTAAALVAAAAGARVAKHGNRSVSSRSGSADLLAALGVRIDLEPREAVTALDQVGLAFLFAPRLHPAMKAVMPVRKTLGIRTLFNVLGPLTNPAGARRQVMGVYAEGLVEPIARVLASLGAEHALVVHGSDGLDEITLTGTTKVAEVRGASVRAYELDPRDLGLTLVPPAALDGGSPEDNAERLEALTSRPGDPELRPLVDIVALNAGAALRVAGRATDLGDGLAQARAALQDGRAHATLEALRRFGRDTPLVSS